MSDGASIGPEDLSLAGGGGAACGPRVSGPPDEEDLKKVLKQISKMTEEQIIRRVLARTDGNRTKAAQRLGISRRALITKIQDLGL
jgi:two-component system response regulator AtoC